MDAKVTVPEIIAMKSRREKITALTAYDYAFSRILDEAGVDIILVGDSLGVVVQGRENTLPVTLAEMIYHTRAVARPCSRGRAQRREPFTSSPVSSTGRMGTATSR